MSEFLTVCMYMDSATAASYFSGGGVGINNADFTGSVVPFAPTSEGEVIALKKYARAHRANRVQGPPFLLLTIKIPACSALDHFVARDIRMVDGRPEETIGFTRAVSVTNYPSMLAEVAYIEDATVADNLLLEGRQLLNLGP